MSPQADHDKIRHAEVVIQINTCAHAESIPAGKTRAVFVTNVGSDNAIWRDPENVPQDGIDRMNKFWGDYSWRSVAYVESKQQSLSASRTRSSNPTMLSWPRFANG